MTAAKDDRLADLARAGNVAAFVSFSPGRPTLRHAFVGGERVPAGAGVEEAVGRVLAGAAAGTVNVRTFRPGGDGSTPFHYGLATAAEAAALVRAAAADGLHTIVNETIDIHDGGVSGVSAGGVLEFAPDDTPRAVERPGTVGLDADAGRRLLATVYGAELPIPVEPRRRYEFSVHPGRVGHRREHVLLWEVDDVEPGRLERRPEWPCAFSRLVGDKTFGLLVADLLGAPVPATTATTRRLAPFSFGAPTGTGEWWLRTAPAEQAPGHFTTAPRWQDPFALLAKEDPEGRVAAVLAQEGVDARWSGATLPRGDGDLVEGVAGSGAGFMLGNRPPDPLPAEVEADVRGLLARLGAALGRVRLEWAHDGQRAWALQLHRQPDAGAAGVLSPGEADRWLTYRPAEGLARLRELVERAKAEGAGVEVEGAVGVTSHVGDLVRKAGVPARFTAAAAAPELG